jgi:hypothetical protein
MTDDEIVEVLAKAAHDASPYRPTWEAALDYERDIFRMEQRAALAALRKAGCEVVVWRPVAEYDADRMGVVLARALITNNKTGAVFWQFDFCCPDEDSPNAVTTDGDATGIDWPDYDSFAILTGPESNNG